MSGLDPQALEKACAAWRAATDSYLDLEGVEAAIRAYLGGGEVMEVPDRFSTISCPYHGDSVAPVWGRGGDPDVAWCPKCGRSIAVAHGRRDALAVAKELRVGMGKWGEGWTPTAEQIRSWAERLEQAFGGSDDEN